MRPIAKVIARSDFLLQLLKSLWVQTTLITSSKLQIRAAYEIAQGSIETSRKTHYQEILGNLKLLRAVNLGEGRLIRVGPHGEGGYVIFDMLNELNTIVSIGIGMDTSFEEDLNYKSNRSLLFHLFDHTARPIRKLPENFNFYSTGIASYVEGNHLITLEAIVQRCLNEHSVSLLKIDVDGSEYEALPQVRRETYSHFEQIVIEFHDLAGNSMLDGTLRKILQTLSEDFFVIHLHPNNFEPWVSVEGFALPNVLEVTFLNRKYLNQTNNELVIFPRQDDAPNNLENEMILGAFYFPDPD